MMMWKNHTSLWLGFAMLAASSAFAQPAEFPDVPSNHWARKALRRALDTGILIGFEDGTFRGKRLINRYQMAMVIQRIFDTIQREGGATAVGYDEEAIDELEKAMIEYADELALFNVKLQRLEEDSVKLRNDLDTIKSQGMGDHHGKSLSQGFSGFVSVGFVDTDRQTCVGCPAGTTGLSRYTAPAYTNFFTIPQSSLALDTEVGKGIGLHVQWDYATDAANPVGGGVGLNEAYLVVDQLFGSFGGKVGGFALPFQSWEINGAFRSSQFTITPSAKNTYLESQRVLGIEFEKTQNRTEDDLDLRVGIFTASDGGSWALPVGPQSDGVGLGATTGIATLDDNFGYYFDLEGGQKRNPQAGYRLGYFDIGGDASSGSAEADGWQVGFWFQGANVHYLFEYMEVDQQLGATVSSMNALYGLANWQLNDRDSVSVRVESWANQVAGVTGRGSSFTFGLNRKVSENSTLQFEYLSPDDHGPPTDLDDDLIQVRYKVWF